uniref:Uncharacterized protein n=1 Tax=Anopheles maculatus TaxID=74869 RepID=A0A182TAP5_9DIPT
MNGGTIGAALPKDIVTGREWSADTIEDVNAATAMLALKHGSKIYTESSFRNGQPPVITTSPSEDHTYSAGGVGVPELANGHPAHVPSAEDVEERRRQEGVFALLNLAQMTYSHSPSSSMSSSTSTLSSPASSTGSLKRAAPNDAPYAPVHTSSYRQQQHAGSPDRARTASPQIAHHHHLLPANNGHLHAEPGTTAGGNILQTIPIVSYYSGGGSSSSSSGDLTTRQYASPPPAKKTKARSSLKKLKKKSLGR